MKVPYLKVMKVCDYKKIILSENFTHILSSIEKNNIFILQPVSWIKFIVILDYQSCFFKLLGQ